MKLRTLSIALATLGLLAAATTAAMGLSSGIMATVTGVIAAANADSATRVNSYFSPNAVVIDEFAPYTWSGANAGAAWWTAIDTGNAKAGVTHLRATVGRITQYDVGANAAYVVVPLTITMIQKGKASRETGLWTLTLRRAGVLWKITTAGWARMTSM
jgi:ketosteroid isomerase-like protein